jgi:glycosyltransferase involved in cell wall biosynthesis
MLSPTVSVVIPAYNQANYLAEAVQSVLDQTYANLEVIVVNDASTDHTDEVMDKYNDPRIKYLVHSENRYAASARNTGIRASRGELIAFLDADDRYHPEKLKTQVEFLAGNSAIGLTYNSRINIDESGSPLSIELAPSAVTLSDLVIDYPFAPSEVVMRKEWAHRVGLFDEKFVFNGEDPDFHMRLALSGCQMWGVKKVLNFRRHHKWRIYRNLNGVVDEQIRAFENTFADPRCPSEILALRNKSLGKITLFLSYLAFAQNEVTLGRDLIRKSIRFDRSILNDEAKRYREFMIKASIRDGGEHEKLLRRVFAQLPPELEWITQYADSAVAHGYLLRGTRDILWGRIEQGSKYLSRAEKLGAEIDEAFLNALTQHLINYQAEFGVQSAQQALRNLLPSIRYIGNAGSVRWLMAKFSSNRAFNEFRVGNYAKVIGLVLKAISSNPRYLANRGIIAILMRSMTRLRENISITTGKIM